METTQPKAKELKFNTDAKKIRAGVEKSAESLERRIKNVQNAKYITQEMLRREVSI